MGVPVKLGQCPIVDAIFDLQFIANLDSNAVFGVIYSTLKDKFGKVETLPLAMTPEHIRNNDPNLKFRPLYRIRNNQDPNFIVQIGPSDITISSSPYYVGWDQFHENINYVVNNVMNLGIISNIIRVGIRYINFFENVDIFHGNANVEIIANGVQLPYSETHLRTIFKSGNMNTILNIGNEMTLNNMGKISRGSIVDVDTFMNSGLDSFDQNFDNIICKIHKEEKSQFFSILSNEFINKLDPQY